VVLGTKQTGDYRVTLRDDGGELSLDVLYTGPYGGGWHTRTTLHLVDDERRSRRELQRWFSGVTGDNSVAELLAEAGYNEYGVLVSGPYLLTIE
jgi:hypothetical protein